MSQTQATATIRRPEHNWHLSFGGVMRSEWIKFITVRSTFWTYLISIVLTLGFGLMTSSLIPASEVADESQASVGSAFVAGYVFAQLAVAVLGAIYITSEYSSGMVRATFSAVPRRLLVLSAKSIILVVTTFLLMTITLFVTFVVSSNIATSRGIAVSLGDPGVSSLIWGTASYLTGTALIGLIVGTLIRSTAGAVTITVGLIFIVPIILVFIPGSIGEFLSKYYLASAAGAFLSGDSGALLSPLAGALVFLAYIVVLWVAAAVLLKRRDA